MKRRQTPVCCKKTSKLINREQESQSELKIDGLISPGTGCFSARILNPPDSTNPIITGCAVTARVRHICHELAIEHGCLPEGAIGALQDSLAAASLPAAAQRWPWLFCRASCAVLVLSLVPSKACSSWFVRAREQGITPWRVLHRGECTRIPPSHKTRGFVYRTGYTNN